MNVLGLIPGIGPVVEKILGLIPDVNERARAEAAFNKAEAAHSSVFVSGWRPFFGWIGGAALAFNYLVRPFWVWAVEFWFPGSPVPPALDGMLWELVFGMLGIGGLRTIEKWRGVAR